MYFSNLECHAEGSKENREELRISDTPDFKLFFL